ncbi:hypothetical protein MP638_001795 [Amoeboaphelidium occidentale]|nr:hypothetical protein MP638_001795 [Amoeboaphelidium occidentale]
MIPLLKRTPPTKNLLLKSSYHTKSKRRTDPTPPSWYKQNCLMYGEYTVEKQGVKPSYLKASNKTILREPALKLKTDEPPAHWLMNPQEELLYSQILQKQVKIRVSKEALRMIDYCGGLDEYILFNFRDRMGSGSVGRELYDLMIKKMKEKNLLIEVANNNNNNQNNNNQKKMTSSVDMLNDRRIIKIREGFRLKK